MRGVVSMDPSWHHNYASLAWIGGSAEAHREAHYPSIKPELVELTSALHGLAHDADMRAQYIKDASKTPQPSPTASPCRPSSATP